MSSHIEEHSTKFASVRADAMLRHWRRGWELLLALGTDQATSVATVHRLDRWLMHLMLSRLSENTHHHRARTMRTLMLAQVVGPRELLATVGALKRLVVRVERPVVALEMLLSAETAAAKSANECLGWIIRQ